MEPIEMKFGAIDVLIENATKFHFPVDVSDFSY